MSKPNLYFRIVAVSVIVVGLRAQPLFATTSGLNNIPTADVTPFKVLVLQGISNFGSRQPTRLTGGFKYGIAPGWEIGYDGLVNQTGSGAGVTGAGGAPSYDATFQIKYRREFRGSPLSLGFGVANLSTNSNKAGGAVQYLVASHKLGKVNGHLGYMFTTGKDNVFAGLDGAASSRLRWRVDFNNLNATNNLLSSVGFIYTINKDWVFEGWLSTPRANGVKDTVTLKINYVIRL